MRGGQRRLLQGLLAHRATLPLRILLVNRGGTAILRPMRWLDRLERRAGWLAFPGLFRYYVLLGVLTFCLSWIRADLDLAALLEFDRTKIFRGEVWRLVTFLFAPDAFGRPGVLAVVLLYFAVMIGFLINDSLEATWGVFRTSMFLYCGMFLLALGNLLLPSAAFSGELFYTSAFFAFATLYPRHEFLMFFILPVQVRFLAIFAGVGILFQALGRPILFPFYLFAFGNYLLWILPGFLGDKKALAAATARRQRYEKAKHPKQESFHECAVCGRTEHDAARLDFRVGRDGREYCLDHLDADGTDPAPPDDTADKPPSP